jgi:hypothetical protein
MTKEEMVKQLRDMAYFCDGKDIYLPESLYDYPDSPLSKFSLSEILSYLADMVEE